MPVSVRDIPSIEEHPGADEPIQAAVEAQWERVLTPGGMSLWLNKKTRVVQTSAPWIVPPVEEGKSFAEGWPEAHAAAGTDAGRTSVELAEPTPKTVDVAVPVKVAWDRVGKKGLAHAIPVTPRSIEETQGAERELWKKALEKELASLEANTVFER